MGVFENFPYTNFHELNADWLIKNVRELENRVINLENSSGIVTENTQFLTVEKDGEYQTVNSAIDKAKEIIAERGGQVTILICEGSYNEEITLLPNPGINLVGIGKVTIWFASTYPNSPIYMTGRGIIDNITFIVETGGNQNTYAFHFEGYTEDSYAELIFRNCTFLSKTHSAIGCGGNTKGGYVRFYNCNFSSTTNYAVYIHNRVAANDKKFNFGFYGCTTSGWSGGYRVDDSAYIFGDGATSRMAIDCVGCSYDTVRFVKTENNTINYIPSDDDNISVRFADDNVPGLSHHPIVRSSGYFTPSGGLIVVPKPVNRIYKNHTVASNKAATLHADKIGDVTTLFLPKSGDDYYNMTVYYQPE